MPSPEQLLAVAREWVLKADEDPKAAANLMKMGGDCPTAAVGFHAQQCVEKCLKARLVSDGMDFPRTHDIEMLVSRLPVDAVTALPVAAQRELTTYATVTRYPGDYDPVSLRDARQAISWARRVRREVRGLMLGSQGGLSPATQTRSAKSEIRNKHEKGRNRKTQLT